MEWFDQIIGFLIVLFVLLFPLLRKLLIDKKKVEEKPEIVEEVEEQPPPPPVVIARPPTTERLLKKGYAFESTLTEREFESKIEERHLQTRIAPKFRERIVSEAFILDQRRQPAKKKLVQTILKRDPGKAMIILSEIVGKPKGLS